MNFGSVFLYLKETMEKTGLSSVVPLDILVYFVRVNVKRNKVSLSVLYLRVSEDD